ncbi:MAG TPA: hypothetical protein VGQ32_07030 [Thermoanaerobaculia bacterium]|nr:hypothetical protein [Thermoanaerobaculia bacterium]
MTEQRVGVESVSLEQAGDLKADLLRLVPGPLRSCGQAVTAHTRAEYWLEEIRADLESPGSQLLLARPRGRTAGLAVVADLAWESRVLGRRMKGIRHLAAAGAAAERAPVLDRLVHEAVRRAEEEGVECLVHRCPADDVPAIHALERRGFLLMDTLMDYVVNLETAGRSFTMPLPPAGTRIRLAVPGDLDGLVDVSRRAFAGHFGRFHADERIPPEDAARVYEEWIRSCMEGWADWILVADAGGKVAGYTAWKKPSSLETRLGIELAHFSIGAVAPENSASGLFGAMTGAGMRLMMDHAARRIDGPMHASQIPVQRAFASLGWRVAGARHAFHRWSKPA